MSMQSQLWSISALAVELKHDRRTLAGWLDELAPEVTDADGTKRWKLRAALDHIERKRNPAPAPDQSAKPETGAERLQRLQAEELEIKIEKQAGPLISRGAVEPAWSEDIIAFRIDPLRLTERGQY